MKRHTLLSTITIISLTVFFLAPVIPVVVPCYKGGANGIFGYRFEGLQSPSYAIFGIGVSTTRPEDCYLP